MKHEDYVCESMIGRENIVTSWGYFITRGIKSGKIVKGSWMHRVVFRGKQIIALHEFADSLHVAEALEFANLTENAVPTKKTSQ